MLLMEATAERLGRAYPSVRGNDVYGLAWFQCPLSHEEKDRISGNNTSAWGDLQVLIELLNDARFDPGVFQLFAKVSGIVTRLERTGQNANPNTLIFQIGLHRFERDLS